MLTQKIQNKVDTWLHGSYDESTKKTLRKMLLENKEEVVEAFYKDLSFGTGGLRGIMGIGTNRMNRYTVGMATQGLAQYLKDSFPNETISIVIAYDSRNNSAYFSEVAAKVMAANGIKVYMFSQLRPTPLLSFAIRYLKTHSGIVITASHNPKEYNGYKAYWQDGAQVITPHDINIIEEVQKINTLDQVKNQDSFENITYLDSKIEDAYLKKLQSLSLNPEVIIKHKNLKIVYTSIHGTGITLVPRALELFGFTNVHIVEEQAEPDGNFPTVIYPNPEEKEALKLALKKAKSIDADVLLGTDPDTDRVGIAVKNLNNEFELLNGNQTASLVLYYIMEQRAEKNIQTPQDFIAKTIVTTDLIDKIAEDKKVTCFNTLTGFKYISDIIRKKELHLNYLGGAEESYGLMLGDFIRDKDAVGAVAVICEMVCVAKEKYGSLFNMLLYLYKKYGFYKEHLISLTKKGKNGAELIDKMMENWRKTPPDFLADSSVVEVKDYLKQVHTYLDTGQKKSIDLPVSNVLQFIAKDGTKLSARPSGTEPKIKFYISVNQPLNTLKDFERIEKNLKQKIAQIEQDVLKY